LFYKYKYVLNVTIHVSRDIGSTFIARRAQFGAYGNLYIIIWYSSSAERDVHYVAKLFLEDVVIVQEVGNERKRYFS